MVILDTCALIELCLDEPSFSRNVYDLLEHKGAVLLSVSFAEIALKIKKKKLVLDHTARELFDLFKQVTGVRIVDIGCEEWFSAIDLDWRHNDPADRLIVAYAKNRMASIITTDKEIKRFYKNVIW